MVSTSLAVEFAKNKKTMLVDADIECPNGHLLLFVERKKDITGYLFLATVLLYNMGKAHTEKQAEYH